MGSMSPGDLESMVVRPGVCVRMARGKGVGTWSASISSAVYSRPAERAPAGAPEPLATGTAEGSDGALDARASAPEVAANSHGHNKEPHRCTRAVSDVFKHRKQTTTNKSSARYNGKPPGSW
jgi:hypothetical protein